MFDTMTFTKVLGGFCGALLLFMLVGWGGETLYHTGGGHGHGEDTHGDAYPIEVAATDAVEEAEEGPGLAELMAVADPAKGERAFRKCRACHAVEDGKNGTGPHLFGIVGRPVASVAAFGGYSETLAGLGGEWTAEALDGFIENPKAYAPGTNMSFKGIDKIEERANLIAYLQSFGN